MGLLSRWLFCSLLLAFAGMGSGAPTEYQVKAVFLFNFTQFVDWPDSAFEEPDAPLIIGVLGNDPFGAVLDEIVAGETVRGRPLAVRRYESVTETDGCHILFINLPTMSELSGALERLRMRNVLTVGDAREFASAGGVIEFMSVDNRIRLRVNLDAAKQANLAISSKLLRPATIVKTR